MILEGRYHGAVEGLGDVVPDGVGVESIHQGLNSLVVLIALLQDVYKRQVMVVISTAFAYLIGLPLGVALILTQPCLLYTSRCV